MRRNLLLMLTLALVPMSGCLGFGDNETAETETPQDCPDRAEDHGEESMEAEGQEDPALNVTLSGLTVAETSPEPPAGQNGTQTDGCPHVAPPTPNSLPTAVLTMTDAEGNPVNGTAIQMGETITFSAAGTEDTDGSIDLIGLTVSDANGTRNAALYEDGAFVDVTLLFEHAGTVNVTLRVLDDDGEGTIVEATTFVNAVETGSRDMTLFDPDAKGCNPHLHHDQAGLVGNYFRVKDTVNVQAGVQWISVEATGVRHVVICNASAETLASGDSGASTADDPASSMEPSPEYFIALYPSAPDTTVAWTTVLHYEPA